MDQGQNKRGIGSVRFMAWRQRYNVIVEFDWNWNWNLEVDIHLSFFWYVMYCK